MGAQEGSTDAVAIKSELTRGSPSSDSSNTSPNDSEGSRGRKKERDSSLTPKADPDGENEDDADRDMANGKPRKRKRSRKGLEKNFPCTHPGCGKTYSRAEHLYRHQLNRRSQSFFFLVVFRSDFDLQIPVRRSMLAIFRAVTALS